MLALVLALSLTSASQKWVALVHVTGDVPSTWQKELQQAAEQNKQGSQWTPPPQVTLEEAQLALGCPAWNKACAGQIANMSGAGYAFVVDVAAKEGGGVSVKTQSVKANGASVGGEDTLELQGKTEKDLEFAKDFVKNGGKGTRSAYLVVESDIPATEIFVDDERRGTGKWQGMLTPGEHRLRLSSEGHAPISKAVTLKAGFEETLQFSMTAAGPPVETSTSVGTGLPHEDHEVKTQPAAPDSAASATTSTPAPAASAPTATPAMATVGWSLAGAGGVIAIGGGVLAGSAIYDRYYNRISCTDPTTNQPTLCFPNRPALLGIYSKGARDTFIKNDAPGWIGGSLAAVGVGVLLVGTGVVLAIANSAPEPPSTSVSQ